MSGTLYIVATPIGNLEDITYRAIRILKEVDLIAAEDTRHTLKLLNHFGINKPLTSYYEHNKMQKSGYLINELLSGKNIALVSDAGTPAISDPGEDLVKYAVENEIVVSSIPGPSAAINALVMSALPTGKFCFEGFLPMNKKSRKETLEEVKDEWRTIIFYEAPHKLKFTLKDLYDYLGDRNISLAREMTKKHEEVIRTTISGAINLYNEIDPKGEYVLIIEGAKKSEKKVSEENNYTIEEHLKHYINQGVEKKEAIKMVAQARGISKREVYNIDIMNKK